MNWTDAAAVALFFVTRPGPAPLPIPVAQPHQMMVASLMMTDKSASVPAAIDMTTGEMSIPHADMAPAGKSAQLWMIGGDGVPKPMGLLAAQGTSRMTLAPDQRRDFGARVNQLKGGFTRRLASAGPHRPYLRRNRQSGGGGDTHHEDST